MSGFLPISKKDLNLRGWEQCDFIVVTGDAYVDHPSFGAAIISRLLESLDFKVGIIAQPDWKTPESFKVLGRPKYGFLVTAGNIDSMVSNYTASKKIRSDDKYSPGGKGGKRPDRASIVYSAAIRQAFKQTTIILGGLEVSLRRLGHYDYWSDKVRRSILLDSKADLLVYGMAEHQIKEIAVLIRNGIPLKEIQMVRGTVWKTSDPDLLEILKTKKNALELPLFKKILDNKRAFAESFFVQHENTDPFTGKLLIEPYESDSVKEFIVQNPPSLPLSQKEMDAVYDLPFERTYHPVYKSEGGIPAIEEVQFSLTSSRGCFGSCSFCSLTFHQGRIIQNRSHTSLIKEAEHFISENDFKGYIHDVGGPTANFRQPACDKQAEKGSCRGKNCLSPEICSNLRADHSDYIQLLGKLRALKGVKKVFIRSGIRFDYLLADMDDTFFKEMVEHHISGQLKVAPEHVSPKVLRLMGKPSPAVYSAFVKKYRELNDKLGKKQFLVPYFISSHPGSELKDAVLLAEYLRDSGFIPEQVQDFYPTPGTLSTCMYYSGFDPRTMQEVYTAKNAKDKALQRALLQFRNPKNRQLVIEALQKAGRTDLIGTGSKCLIRPGPKQRKQRNNGRQEKHKYSSMD